LRHDVATPSRAVFATPDYCRRVCAAVATLLNAFGITRFSPEMRAPRRRVAERPLCRCATDAASRFTCFRCHAASAPAAHAASDCAAFSRRCRLFHAAAAALRHVRFAMFAIAILPRYFSLFAAAAVAAAVSRAAPSRANASIFAALMLPPPPFLTFAAHVAIMR